MKRGFYLSWVIVPCLLFWGGIQVAWCVDFSATIDLARNSMQTILNDENMVGFSVGLISDNEIVWQEGFGYADREKQIPVTSDTVYAIGSVSKTFTAVSVLQQVEQGRIDLDRPVSDYLPEFSLLHRYGNSREEQNAAITVRRLLNHHSGVPGDIFAGLFLEGPSYYSTYMPWLLQYLTTSYPSHEPGVATTYSNTGYELAGEIARRVGAQEGEDDFGYFLERMVLQPLGMNHSCTHVVGKDIPHLAMGYIGSKPVSPFDINGVATGGIYSTISDMSLFLQMLINDGIDATHGTRFLTSSSVKEMGRMDPGKFDFSNLLNPGLGFDCVHLPRFIDVIPPIEENGHLYGRAWSKDGSTNNFTSLINLLPDQKLAVVLLANSDSGGVYFYDLAERILVQALHDKLAMEVPKPTLPDYSELAVTDPSLITGTYSLGNVPMEIAVEESGSLNLISHPGTDQETTRKLNPYNGSHFVIEGNTAYLTFISKDNHIFLLSSGGETGTFAENLVLLAGEKIDCVDTPESWLDRLGMYVYDVKLPYDALWEIYPITEELILQNNTYLMFDALALPQSDTLAFLPELSSRSDSQISVDESGGLCFGGYHYTPVKSISAMTLGEEYSYEMQYFNTIPKILWRSFEIDSEQATRMIYWKVSDPNVMLRFYDESFSIRASGSGVFALNLEPGTYYLGVFPDLGGAPNVVYSSSLKPNTSNVRSWELY